MLTASYRPRARTVWIPLRTSIEICRLGEGHSLCQWECKIKKELMHRHCGTNNRAPHWTFTDPCKPKVRPCAREESASPAWLAAPTMNARDTTKVYIWRLDTGGGPTLYRKCHSHNTLIICWKTFPAKTTKMLSTRNSNILIMSSSVYLLFESECSFTK